MFSDFDLLRGHYRKNHYLCELDQCKDVQFTNVFSSDFEFRAHQAAQHGKTRAQAKQLGTIPVEFQSRNAHDRRQAHDPAHRGENSHDVRIILSFIFQEHSKVVNLIQKKRTNWPRMNG